VHLHTRSVDDLAGCQDPAVAASSPKGVREVETAGVAWPARNLLLCGGMLERIECFGVPRATVGIRAAEIRRAAYITHAETYLTTRETSRRYEDPGPHPGEQGPS